MPDHKVTTYCLKKLDMTERLPKTKAQRMQAINGGSRNLGVILSLVAPDDFPFLSSQAVQARMEAASDNVSAVAGRLGDLRRTRQELPTAVPLLVATGLQGDTLEQEADVLDAIAEKAQAIGVGYYKHSASAAEQRELLKSVRREVLLQGEQFPIFVSLYPGRPESDNGRVLGVRDAVVRGADAVVVSRSDNNAKVIEASNPAVPVYIRLGGDYNPSTVLMHAAQARDAGAGGVVIGDLSLPQGGEKPRLRHMMTAIWDVMNDEKSPEAAYRKATSAVL